MLKLKLKLEANLIPNCFTGRANTGRVIYTRYPVDIQTYWLGLDSRGRNFHLEVGLNPGRLKIFHCAAVTPHKCSFPRVDSCAY